MITVKMKEGSKIAAQEIPIGAFKGEVGSGGIYGIYIRTYNSVVLLSDPEKVWNLSQYLHISKYTPIDIEVKEV